MTVAPDILCIGSVLWDVIGRDEEGIDLLAACTRLGLVTSLVYLSDDLPTDRYMAVEGANGLPRPDCAGQQPDRRPVARDRPKSAVRRRRSARRPGLSREGRTPDPAVGPPARDVLRQSRRGGTAVPAPVRHLCRGCAGAGPPGFWLPMAANLPSGKPPRDFSVPRLPKSW